MSGRISKLHTGYGFIIAEDRRSYFFHATALNGGGCRFDELQAGADVTFTPTMNERGLRAEDVRVVA